MGARAEKEARAMRPFRSLRRCRLTAAVDGALTANRGPRNLFALLGVTAIALTGNVLPAFATTYIVDTALDPGPGGTTSLRQAIFQANASANNIIQFAPA